MKRRRWSAAELFELVSAHFVGDIAVSAP